MYTCDQKHIKRWTTGHDQNIHTVEALLATPNAKNEQVSLHHCHPANDSFSQTVLAEVIKNIKHVTR